MFCRNHAPRRCRSRGCRTSISDRNDRSRRTPARRSLAVDNLLQAAMFKQNMLSSAKVVGRFAKLIGDPQRRSVAAMVIDAGIAIARHTKSKIKLPGTLDRKAQVRREDDVAAIRCHLHFDRSAIECEHQRLDTCSSSCPESSAVRSSSRLAPFLHESGQSRQCGPSR